MKLLRLIGRAKGLIDFTEEWQQCREWSYQYSKDDLYWHNKAGNYWTCPGSRELEENLFYNCHVEER